MKGIRVQAGGIEYILAFDGEAMFTVRDKFGSAQLLVEAIEPDTREGFRAACGAAAILAERGELIRRRLGYAPGPLPEADDFICGTIPADIVSLKNAVIRAITLGYGREVESPNNDEVDLALAEINQKKTH